MVINYLLDIIIPQILGQFFRMSWLTWVVSFVGYRRLGYVLAPREVTYNIYRFNSPAQLLRSWGYSRLLLRSLFQPPTRCSPSRYQPWQLARYIE